MSDNIRYTRENVENNVGDALKVRQRAMVGFRDLGQPDLCYLVKIRNRLLQPLAHGFFHFVLGLDVSSTAPIALYYKHLQEHQEEVGFFQSFEYYHSVEGFQYCCYNAFAQADLNVEIAKNGHMKVYAITRSLQRLEILTPEFWDQTALSAHLRAVSSVPTLVPCLKSKNPMKTAAQDTAFMTLVHKYFAHGFKTVAGFLENDPKNQFDNPFTRSLMTYLLHLNRFTDVITLVEQNLGLDPQLRLYLALALFWSGNSGKALECVQAGISAAPNSVPLLLLHAEFLLALKRTDEALDIANAVLRLQGGQLAKVYSIAAECCFVLRGSENFTKALHHLLSMLSLSSTGEMDHGWLNPVRRTPSLATPRAPRSPMVLPPYSRQTAPTEVHHPLLQVDLQEDEAFHSDGAIRAFPFYRLNDAQKEGYRLLSATDPADWTTLGKAWHAVEAEESTHLSSVSKASAPTLASSMSPKRNASDTPNGSNSEVPAAAAEFKEISLDDRPSAAGAPGAQQDPAKLSFGLAYRAWEEEVQMWAKMQKEKIQRFESNDWIRSGLLAWRLCKPLEGQTLLEEAAKGPNVPASIAAWKELIEIYALRYDTKNVLIAANQLLDHFLDDYEITEPHPRVVRALVQIVGRHGLKEVTAQLKQLVEAPELTYRLRFAEKILEVIDRMKTWRSLGYDR